VITCGCGLCRPSEGGEPGLWTAEYTRHYVDAALRECRRQYYDEVQVGSDGIRRCPNPHCRDVLHDDWTVTPRRELQERLIDGG